MNAKPETIAKEAAKLILQGFANVSTVKTPQQEKAIALAHELMNGLGEEDRAKEKALTDDEIIDWLRKYLKGVSIVSITQFLSEPERVVLRGKAEDSQDVVEVTLGTMRTLTTMRDFCEKLARGFHVYPTFERGEWETVRDRLLRLVKNVDVPGGGEREGLRDLLTRYIEHLRGVVDWTNASEQDKECLAFQRMPHRIDGRIYFGMEDFQNWIRLQVFDLKSDRAWAAVFTQAGLVCTRRYYGKRQYRVWSFAESWLEGDE